MPLGREGENSWGDCHSSLSLVGRDFPAPEEFISGFLTTGLTVIAASPKAGKTWLCHEFALSVAEGKSALQTLPALRADVHCLFLEDSLARIQRREHVLLGRKTGCQGITYSAAGSKWSPKRIERYLDDFPTCRLMVIDTAERFKQQQTGAGAGNGNSRVYSEDYAFWGEFQGLAMRRNIALIVIHHDRKPAAGNGGNGKQTLDSVSGTRAITGSADHIWLLDRDVNTDVCKLTVEGRDLERGEVSYVRGEDWRFRVVGGGEGGGGRVRSAEDEELMQQAICMREGGMSLREISEALGKGRSTVGRWLRGAE